VIETSAQDYVPQADLSVLIRPTSDRNQFVMTIDVMGSPNWFFSQSRKRNRADPADALFHS